MSSAMDRVKIKNSPNQEYMWPGLAIVHFIQQLSDVSVGRLGPRLSEYWLLVIIAYVLIPHW